MKIGRSPKISKKNGKEVAIRVEADTSRDSEEPWSSATPFSTAASLPHDGTADDEAAEITERAKANEAYPAYFSMVSGKMQK